MAAIWDFPLINTSGSLRSNLVVLPDPKHGYMAVGIFVGIMYTSWNIHNNFLLPVNFNGNHCLLPTYLNDAAVSAPISQFCLSPKTWN